MYVLFEVCLLFDLYLGMMDVYCMCSCMFYCIVCVEWCWVGYVGNDIDYDGDEFKFEVKGFFSVM